MSLTHQLYLQRLRELERVQPASFDDYRGPLLATLIEHAWREVPAYQGVLSRLIEGDGFDLDRWTELPLLRLADLQRSTVPYEGRTLRPPLEDFEDIDPAAAMPIRRRSTLSRIAAECERELIYEMWRLPLSKPLAILHPDHPAIASGRGWSITFARNVWSAGPCWASPDEQLKWLSETGARTLRTSAAIAKGLAEAAASRGGKVALDAVILTGPEAPPDLEVQVAAAFGARLRALLELPVVGLLAAARDDGSYALPAASNVFEIVDPAGRSVTSGQVGELVISPLYEFATPLLRFATGMAAVMPAEPRTALGIRDLPGVKAPARR